MGLKSRDLGLAEVLGAAHQLMYPPFLKPTAQPPYIKMKQDKFSVAIPTPELLCGSG